MKAAHLRRLVGSHGALRPGTGLRSGVLALVLAVLGLLLMLSLRWPAQLTTPELRALLGPDLPRLLFNTVSLAGGGLALANVLRGRQLRLSAFTFGLVALSALGVSIHPGGSPSARAVAYLGMDWFVLDLLASTLMFVFIEKLSPLRPQQPIFRAEWQTDLAHFLLSHLGVGGVLLATNLMVHRLFTWAIDLELQAWVQDLPFVLELLLLMLAADLIQYGVHRAMHEWPPLWRFHAVHHSIKTLDWLAGSRLHIGEVLLMRSLVLAPVYVLGFSRGVIDTYIIIVGVQAVLNHANVNWRFGPLEWLLVTPHFHHWHHSRQPEALDRNYAGQFAFLDHLFGTAMRPGPRWPEQYGVLGDTVPAGFWRQLLYPFSRSRS